MDLTLAELVLYIVLGSFALAPVLSVVSRTLHGRAEARSLSHRVICRLCLHAFEETGHVKVVECPVCHARNEKGRCRKLG